MIPIPRASPLWKRNRIDEEGSGWAGYGEKRFTSLHAEACMCWASPIEREGALLELLTRMGQPAGGP